MGQKKIETIFISFRCTCFAFYETKKNNSIYASMRMALCECEANCHFLSIAVVFVVVVAENSNVFDDLITFAGVRYQ